jgi:hypothetical protein
MKQLFSLILLAIFCYGCSGKKSDCQYSKAIVSAYEVGTNKLIDKKEIEDCFTANEVDPGIGLIEVKGSQNPERFKVSYYKENDPSLINMMNIKIGGKVSEWRRKKKHDLFLVNKPDTLAFIFGDRVDLKVKGTILFIR